MATASPTLSRLEYPQEDHDTWAALWQRQMPLAQQHACKLFLEGIDILNLDRTHLPDPLAVSDYLNTLTGWALGDAQNAYLGPTEWFEHIAERRFPVTNYIRRPHELEFTPLPDLFHEYFGHLPAFTNREFADIAQLFGPLYLSAKDERQQLGIARIWWFSTEFGLLRENGELKVLGAGLLSSPGELLHALKPETPRYEFDIERVADTASAPYGYHEHYFILNSLDHLRSIVDEYAELEGLPKPALPL
ncbi:amino acid hydroxylase [Herpetosiphon gulosus]|uniref:Phenylalanine-4-hydroxylase n=1 Tax=Herpetosiphon gulosus TaxID=1973496 RepID=A0ABP9WT11_9CHLR